MWGGDYNDHILNYHSKSENRPKKEISEQLCNIFNSSQLHYYYVLCSSCSVESIIMHSTYLKRLLHGETSYRICIVHCHRTRVRSDTPYTIHSIINNLGYHLTIISGLHHSILVLKILWCNRQLAPCVFFVL